MTELIFSIKGDNGQLDVYENRLEISRKGFKAFMCHGFDGTKIIFISKLTAIQLKEAGKLTKGFIQFVFPGSVESKKGLVDAVSDENTILFTPDTQAEFLKVKDYIVSKIN